MTRAFHRALLRPLDVCLLAFGSVVAAASSYLGVLTLLGLGAARRRPGAGSPPSGPRRFVVLVPAHNEETGIAGTLKSLEELEYPRDRFALHVVADNCTDRTAAVARTFGAQVHERLAPDDPGKGPALTWLLDQLISADEPFDGVVIVDADSVLSRNFLSVMDREMSLGHRAVQGYYGVRDQDSSWQVAIRAAALAVRHHLRPLARTSLGGTAGLRGNGMAFAADLLRGRPWSAHLTEDLEFEAELLLDGERVHFAPEAAVHAEMPLRLRDSATQNARWERGRQQLVRTHVPTLLRAATRLRGRQRFACLDAAVDHLLPPTSVLTGTTVVGALAAIAVQRAQPTRLRRTNVVLLVGSTAAQAAHLAVGLRIVHAPAAVWLSLLRIPVYMAWKVALWTRAIARGPDSWVRTGRNAEHG